MTIDRYAVFGNPVAHSKSPRIHALFAQQTGERLRYDALLAPREGFAPSVRDFIAAGGKGANVTVPFKEDAFRLADVLSARARAAGAVNTLSFDAGRIVGDNTDGAGLVRDLAGNLGVSLRGARVLLLGAGGAARGCLLPLQEQQPELLAIANRTPAKAAHLLATVASEVGAEEGVSRSTAPRLPNGPASSRHSTSKAGDTAIYDFAQLAGLPAFDVIINATSAGLTDAALPLPDSIFGPDALAYDMLYGRETPFMSQARRCGARVADGLGMLVEQAAEAFFIWRGVQPRTAPVLAALRTAP